MIERKKFSFLTYTVIVEVRDTAPEKWNPLAIGGCYDEPDDKGNFVVWFTLDKGAPGLKTIAHECWHLFMTILNHVDKYNHTFEELNNEIYAYNFHMLFNSILESIFVTKGYQRAIAEEDEK